MNTDNRNRWEYGNGSKDAARLSTLMGNTGKPAEPSTRSSIPMPPLERGGQEGNARGAMTLEGYQRLRKGYERGINPEALERMEEQQGMKRERPSEEVPPHYTDDTPTEYVEPTRTNVVYGEPYELEPKRYEPDYDEDYRQPYQPTHTNVMNAPQDDIEEEEPVRRSRRMGPIAVTLVLLIGIVGALLLYAGGIDYLSDLFRSEQPASDENLTLVTERPGAEPQIDPSGTLAPGEEMALNEENEATDPENALGETEGLAEPLDADPAMMAAAEKEREEARREAAELKEKTDRAKKELPKTTPEKTPVKPAVAEAPSRTVTPIKTPAKPSSTAKPTTAPSAPAKTSTGKTYTVQVRATPNKEEADRLARSLRAKGGSDVHIVAAEKNGETVYRVRFGSFNSEAEGKARASEMGYGDVWMIKQ